MLVVGYQGGDSMTDEIGVRLGLGLALCQLLASGDLLFVGDAVVFAILEAFALGVVDRIKG